MASRGISNSSALMRSSFTLRAARQLSSAANTGAQSSADFPTNYTEIATRVIERRADDIARATALAEKKRRSEVIYKRKRAASQAKRVDGNGLGPRMQPQPSLRSDQVASFSRSYATAASRRHKKSASASAPTSIPPVAYATEKNPLSYEIKAFLASSDDAAGGKDDLLAEYQPLSDADVQKWKLADLEGGSALLERGMVVECRRSGREFIAVVLTALVGAGRLRYLMLPSSGEILPASTQDVQFIFPSNIIPREAIADITDHALAQELSGKGDPDDVDMKKSREAKRTLGRALRKVELEVDKRRRELGAKGVLQPKAIWSHFSDISGVDNSEEIGVMKHVWATTHLDDVTRHALGVAPGDPVSTLDSFILHKTLMAAPDLFQADEANMAETQRFSLRPSAQVQVLREVENWVRSHETGLAKGAGGAQEMQDFVRQAKSIIMFRRSAEERRLASGESDGLDIRIEDGYGLEPFSATSRMIISILRMRVSERRTTQTSPYAALAPAILKAIGLYGTEKVDMALLVKSLQEMGDLREWDSLALVRLRDAAVRDGHSAATWERSASRSTTELQKEDEHFALRRDFGNMPVYVIDDASASELDDGISLERTNSPDMNWVHVHIADPTRWINPGDSVARLAERRGATLYVPEGGLAMLESESLMSRMSLGAKSDEGQAVVTFSFKVDSKGSILDHDVRAGLIQNVQKLTYEEASALLEDTSGASDIASDLRTLSGVARSLKLARAKHSLEWGQAHGYVSLDSPLNVDGSTFTTGSPRTKIRTPESDRAAAAAQTLVSELMIAANRTSGAFCAERSLPGLYRGAERPYISPASLPAGIQVEQALEHIRSRRDPSTLMADPVEVAKLDMYMGKVPVDIAPLDHFQLGIFAKEGGYQRSTSPLRRFGDMLVHWQIKQSLLTGRALYTAADMLRKARSLDVLETRVKRAEKAAQQYWLSTYLTQQLAQGGVLDGGISLHALDAVVMAPTKFQSLERVTTTKVTLPQLGAPALIEVPGRTDQMMEVGNRLKVKVVQAKAWPAVILVSPLK